MNFDDPDHVAVSVTRTGGFAGISRAWELDSAQADAGVAARMRALAGGVGTDGAVAPPAEDARPGIPADGFSYDVLLNISGSGWSLLARGTSVLPEELAELVDLVRKHGLPAAPREAST